MALAQSSNKNPAIVINLIKETTPFDGKFYELSGFIKAIERLQPLVEGLSPEDTQMVFACILNTLKGKASRVVLREQPKDWPAIKAILIDEFGDRAPISTLILSTNKIAFEGNISSFISKIKDHIFRVRNKLALSDLSQTKENFLLEELNSSALNNLMEKLPVDIRALLFANNVKDFTSAVEVLKNNNVLHPRMYTKTSNSPRLNKKPENTWVSSNQRRIRKFGRPEEMQVDTNFRLDASGSNSQP